MKFLGDFYPKISFLVPEGELQPTYEVGITHQGAAGLFGHALVSCGGCGPSFVLIPLLKIYKYSKKISINFYRVWTSFDMEFLQNKKHAKNRN